MEKIIKFRPAWDRRTDNPSTDQGIHGVEIWFILKGEHGAVDFSIDTSWYTPTVTAEHTGRDWEFSTYEAMHTPRHRGVSYHSPKPIFDGQRAIGEQMPDFQDMDDIKTGDPGKPVMRIPKFKETGTFSPCEILGGKCYSDGSILSGDLYWKALLEKGDSGLWRLLEKYYKETFGELK